MKIRILSVFFCWKKVDKIVDNHRDGGGNNVEELWITHKYRHCVRKWPKKLDISDFVKYNFLIHYRNVTNNTRKAKKM